MKKTFKSSEWVNKKVHQPLGELETIKEYENMSLQDLQKEFLQKYGISIGLKNLEENAKIEYRFYDCSDGETCLVNAWYEYIFDEPDYSKIVERPLDHPSDVLYYYDYLETTK